MNDIDYGESFLAIVRPDGAAKFSFLSGTDMLCLDPSSNKSMVLEFISVGEGRYSDVKPYKLRFWGYYVDKEKAITPHAESVSVKSPSVAEQAPEDEASSSSDPVFNAENGDDWFYFGDQYTKDE